MSTYRDMSSGDLLVPRSRFVDRITLGDDNAILEDATGVFITAFNSILKLHEPKHPVAIFSLCTATRPYSASNKWGLFEEKFGDRADLIVYSNGGIIPLAFEHQYPFKTYDAVGTKSKKSKSRFREVIGNMLRKFLQAHKYQHVIFASLVKHRAREMLSDIGCELKEAGHLTSFAVMPSLELDELLSMHREKNFHDHLQPLTHPLFLDAVEQQLTGWAYEKSSSPHKS